MKTLIFLVLCFPVLAISLEKQAVVDFEMGTYFWQGKDFANALKYYKKAQGKLKMEEMQILLCRNLASVYMVSEMKKEAVETLSSCIDAVSVEKVESSQALRDVYKMYAEVLADEINPAILDKKREQFQKRVEMMKEEQQKKAGPKLGFK